MKLNLDIDSARTIVTATLVDDVGGHLMSRTFDVTAREGRDELDVFTDAIATDDSVEMIPSPALTRWAEYERPND